MLYVSYISVKLGENVFLFSDTCGLHYQIRKLKKKKSFLKTIEFYLCEYFSRFSLCGKACSTFNRGDLVGDKNV